MLYAIIETGDKQFRVEQGMTLNVPLTSAAEGAVLTFDRVLLCSNGTDIRIGTPTVPDAHVKATVLGEARGEKLVVFKMRRRKASKRKTGHRARFTSVRVDELVMPISGA
jgi:large subunit ribosomal protein L21